MSRSSHPLTPQSMGNSVAPTPAMDSSLISKVAYSIEAAKAFNSLPAVVDELNLELRRVLFQSLHTTATPLPNTLQTAGFLPQSEIAQGLHTLAEQGQLNVLASLLTEDTKTALKQTLTAKTETAPDYVNANRYIVNQPGYQRRSTADEIADFLFLPTRRYTHYHGHCHHNYWGGSTPYHHGTHCYGPSPAETIIYSLGGGRHHSHDQAHATHHDPYHDNDSHHTGVQGNCCPDNCTCANCCSKVSDCVEGVKSCFGGIYSLFKDCFSAIGDCCSSCKMPNCSCPSLPSCDGDACSKCGELLCCCCKILEGLGK